MKRSVVLAVVGMFLAPSSASALLKMGVKETDDGQIKVGKSRTERARVKNLERGRKMKRQGRALKGKGKRQIERGEGKEAKGRTRGDKTLVRRGKNQQKRGELNRRRGERLKRDGDKLVKPNRKKNKLNSGSIKISRDRYDRVQQNARAGKQQRRDEAREHKAKIKETREE